MQVRILLVSVSVLPFFKSLCLIIFWIPSQSSLKWWHGHAFHNHFLKDCTGLKDFDPYPYWSLNHCTVVGRYAGISGKVTPADKSRWINMQFCVDRAQVPSIRWKVLLHRQYHRVTVDEGTQNLCRVGSQGRITREHTNTHTAPKTQHTGERHHHLGTLTPPPSALSNYGRRTSNYWDEK